MEEEMSDIESLLKDVNAISEKYSIAKVLGEDFNIFQTLGLRSKELIHSKFIAELLNPKGSHEMGDVFLKIFLECINMHDFSRNGVKIKTEKFIGHISGDHFSGGRIDILLENKEKKSIVIENKISANDQKNQLSRYEEDNPSAKIFYLTLDGHDPSEESIIRKTGDKVIYTNISYECEIIDWIEKCEEKCNEKGTSFQLLKDTLTQYINVLKELTGQTRRKEMSKEIIEAILRDNNLGSAFDIYENFNETKKKIVQDRFIPAIKKLAGSVKDLDFDDNENNDKNCLRQYWGLSLKHKHLDKKIRIRFEFKMKNLRSLICGFWINEKEKDKAREIYNENNSLRNKIKEAGNPSEPYWLHQCDLDCKLDKEEWIDLNSEDSEDSKIIKECEKKIEELLELLNRNPS